MSVIFMAGGWYGAGRGIVTAKVRCLVGRFFMAIIWLLFAFGKLMEPRKEVRMPSVPGRRCNRCHKDMSDYLVITTPCPTDVCIECEEELRRENYLQQWKSAPLPVYDIDSIIGPRDRGAGQVVQELQVAFVSVRGPSDRLFEPEIVIRDCCSFHELIGYDLGYVMGLSGDGAEVLIRARRALNAVGAGRIEKHVSEFLKVARSRGVNFPDPLPEPWLDEISLDYELQDELDEESRRLAKKHKPELEQPEMPQMIVSYAKKHIDILRKRKPAQPR